jgi:hypothetical protein
MPNILPAGPYRTVTRPNGDAVAFYVIPFDKRGVCEAPQTRAALVADVAGKKYTDVFLFSHGWNNDWTVATQRYDDFLKGFMKMREEFHLATPAAGYRPLLVGIFWPSTALTFGVSEDGPAMAGALDDEAVARERHDLAELGAALAPADAIRFFDLAQRETVTAQEARELADMFGGLAGAQTGETFMVYLCGRPLRNRGRCTLGRETAIQPMAWSPDGWLRTTTGEGIPTIEAPAPLLPACEFPADPVREEFETQQLPLAFQWLRSPWPDELFSLTARPGHLRLFGRETIGSAFRQALVARRQQSHCFTAETVLDYEPKQFQQMAGLVCYYNSAKFHYLYVSHDETAGRHLRVMSSLPDQVQADAFTPPIAIPAGRPVQLRVEVDFDRLRFGYRVDGEEWSWLPQQFDASILSDEATPPGRPNFTGAFVGMACQDLAGTALAADFDYFEYRERAFNPAVMTSMIRSTS